ncbi:MAG: hypothetical protein ACKV2V_15680 [Blastocatellia bacterium]
MRKQHWTSFVIGLAAAITLCLSLAGATLANDQKAKNLKKTMTLAEDAMVGDTPLKKGVYQVRFDAQTSEVSIMRDGELVLKTKAMVESKPTKALYNSVTFRTTDKGREVNGFTFAGDHRALSLGETGNADGR